MPRFLTKTSLLLLLSFSVLSIGCETTDYEPLIMKKKLQDLEAEIESLRREIEEMKGASDSNSENGASDSTTADSKSANFSAKAPAAPSESAIATRESLEDSDAFFLLDDNGFVVEADLAECRKSNDAVGKLAEFPMLSKIILDGTKADASTFDALSKVSGLRHLEIERCNPDPSDLAKLKSLKSLKFLQLFKATLSEDAMKTLSEFPALEQIRCAQTRVGDAELKHLENLKTLKAIDLSDCNRVTIDGVASLAKCPKLAFLKVWGQAIDNDCMREVAKMKSLRVLGISDTNVDDEGVKKLAGLNLTEVHMTRTRVGDAGIEVFSNMPNINSLNLRDTALSDAAIKNIAKLKKLKKLDLSECSSPGITDACGEDIGTMSNLVSLNLWSTRFSDKGVEHLQGLEKLTRLNLDNTKISDDGIAMLSNLPQLTWLHLGKTKITDREVDVLIGLENLKYLNISYTKITDDGYYKIDDHFSPKGCAIIAP